MYKTICIQANVVYHHGFPIKKFIFLALMAIVSSDTAEAKLLGQCGSGIYQRFAVPEYACFNEFGEQIPFAACAVAVIKGFRPVYFGAACSQHDSCYSTVGTKKSSCDLGLKSLIEETCDYTLDGKSQRYARKSCRAIARVFYAAVNSKGCSAYKDAQRASGNPSPTCD